MYSTTVHRDVAQPRAVRGGALRCAAAPRGARECTAVGRAAIWRRALWSCSSRRSDQHRSAGRCTPGRCMAVRRIALSRGNMQRSAARCVVPHGDALMSDALRRPAPHHHAEECGALKRAVLYNGAMGWISMQCNTRHVLQCIACIAQQVMRHRGGLGDVREHG